MTFEDLLDDRIKRFLEDLRGLNIRDERSFHESLSACLPEAEREKRLSEFSRIDFFIPGLEIGIEVKLRPKSIPDVWRQVVRYAREPDLKAVVLVSITPFNLPVSIFGKPVRNVPLFGYCL